LESDVQVSLASSRPLETTRGRSIRFATTSVALAGLVAAVATIPHAGYIALAVLFLGAFFAYMRLRVPPPQSDLFEVIIPFSILNFLYFGIGAVYLVFVPEALSYPALKPFLAPAMALAALGYLCFLAGYALFFRTTRPSPLKAMVPTSTMAYLIPGVLGAAGMSVHQLQSAGIMAGAGISPALSFIQQFGVLFFFAWYLAWYMVLSGRLSRVRGVPILLSLTGLMMIVLYSNFGGKSLAMTMLGLPAMAYYEVKRRLPTKTLVVIALISVFLIFPVYNTFRQTDQSLDTMRRLDHTADVARSWDSDRFLDASVFSFLKRLTIVTSLAAIISDTPRWVDYRYGETLVLAPIGVFIPRFIWREKPNLSIGKEFGATFRLTHAMDLETEIAPTMVGDFYWNFALPGVVVGTLLLGMAYRWYYQRYGAGVGFDPMRKAIYASLLPTALLFEANFAIIVAGFAKCLIIIVVFLIVLRRIGWVAMRESA
jgi:hypothetical protein